MLPAINEKVHLYADDKAILVSYEHVNGIEARLETVLEIICVWLTDMKLS